MGTKVSKDWYVKVFKKSNKEKVFEFLNRTETISKEKWEWRYQNGRFGNPVIICSVAKNSEIVGHQATVPIIVKIKSNKSLVAGWSGHTYVKSNFRGKGMFKKMRELENNEARRKNWSLLLGFPNQMALGGCVRSGYLHIFDFHNLVTILRPFRVSIQQFRKGNYGKSLLCLIFGSYKIVLNIVFHTNKSYNPKNYKIEKENYFNSTYDVFWDSFAAYIENANIRDARYLNWRYAQNPGPKYEIFAIKENSKILGFTVLKLLGSPSIMEFLTLPDRKDIAHILLSHVHKYLSSKGVETVNCICEGVPGFKSLFLKSGYLSNPSSKRAMIAMPLSKVTADDVLNRKKWFISEGDFLMR